jgi:carbamoyltransferase
LLNTSFNIHGKPIVNDEKDAFEVFKKTDLDGIIFTNCLVLKKENSKYL